MKITNELTDLELKLNDNTVRYLTKDELLDVIVEELDSTAKLKVIQKLFKSRGVHVHTKEDLIVEVTNFLHHSI